MLSNVTQKLRQRITGVLRDGFRMHIDTPAPDTRVYQSVSVIGWVFNQYAPIVHVDIMTDRYTIIAADYGYQRPDVYEHYNMQPALLSGFRADVPIYYLPTGNHYLMVRATDTRGKMHEQWVRVAVGHADTTLSVDKADMHGGQLHIEGWFCWQDSQPPHCMRLYLDNALIHETPANYSRPDIRAYLALDTEACHGFRATIAASGLSPKSSLRLEIVDARGDSLRELIQPITPTNANDDTTSVQTVQQLVDEFVQRTGVEPLLLNYNTGLTLDEIKHARLFQPPAPALLPYPDATIDLVVSRAGHRHEAERVARYGFLLLNAASIPVWQPLPAKITPVVPPVRQPNGKHVLVGLPFLPSEEHNSGARHSANVIAMLLDAGWQVTLWVKNSTIQGGTSAQAQRCIEAWEQQGVTLYDGPDTMWSSQRYMPTLRPLLNNQMFDLAIIAHWDIAEDLLPDLREHAPQTRVLVDTIDLHFLREARRCLIEPDGELDRTYADSMMRELTVYAQADGVLAISDKEQRLVQEFLGKRTPVYTVPLFEERPASSVPFEERQGIAFVGNFLHMPNRDAVEYLVYQIQYALPPDLLKQHPIYIVGTGAEEHLPARILAMPHVRVAGWIPDLDIILHRACVSVIPLRYGAGVKGKLLNTMAAGTPAISTSIGVEGMAVTHAEHLLIADDPQAFAGAIVSLLTNREQWSRIAAGGREYVTEHHSRAVVARHFWRAVDALLEPTTH
jgi:glycosyltransferase involved in cell wall biosynthesis